MSEIVSEPEEAPLRPARWGLGATMLWCALISVIFVVVQGLVAVGLGTADGRALAAATVATALVCCPLMLAIVWLKKGAIVREYFAWRRVPAAVMLRWLGIAALFVVVAGLVSRLVREPQINASMQAVYDTADPKWLLWVAVVVAAPLFEEMLMRGFLFTGIQASRFGTIGAILLPAALWSVVHIQYDPFDQAVVFGIGVVLGAARARTASLLVPITIHALENLLAFSQVAAASAQ